MQSSRIVELDGLRGFAALLVVVAHYFGEVPSGFHGLMVAWIGVGLFFVLSGFLIGSIILERRDAPNFLVVFYARRTCRILPIYMITLIATAFALHLLSGEHWADDPLPLGLYFSFTQNLYMAWYGVTGSSWLLPTWTLAVEEQFYLFAPLAILLVPTRQLAKVLLVVLATGPLVRLALLQTPELSTLGPLVLLPSRWDMLICGVLAAHLLRSGRLNAGHADYWLRVLPLISLVALLLLVLIDPTKNLFTISGPLVLGIGGAAFILGVVRGVPEARRYRSPTLQFFGTISYGLYLIHQPISGLLHGLLLDGRPDIATIPQVAVTLLALAVSILLAWASWRLVEKRVLQLGRQWSYSSPLQPSPLRVSRQAAVRLPRAGEGGAEIRGLVEQRGIEPLTSALRTPRSPN